MENNFKMYLHCRACRTGLLEVGLLDPETLALHCPVCDKPVGSFQLKEAIPMQCEACGEEAGPNHHH